MLTIALCLMLQQPQAPAQAHAPAPATAPAQPAPAAAQPATPAAATPAPAAPRTSELLQVKSVYLLPMSNGFDQFLASEISRKGVFQVVTDPSLADALLTDRLGKGFELAFGQLYPEPKAETPQLHQGQEEEEEQPARPELKASPVERVTSFGRGKGTVFLVSRNSRNVVWSMYARPKTSAAKDLNNTARDVAGQLSSTVTNLAKTGGQAPAKSSWWHW